MSKQSDRNYNSHSHRKYSLKVHIILVPKYRKPLFKSKQFTQGTKQCMFETCCRNGWTIEVMEADTDHMHLLISYDCTDRVCDIVKALKQESAYYLKAKYSQYLQKYYWGTDNMWTHGYFACSTGEVSTETVRAYIESQG